MKHVHNRRHKTVGKDVFPTAAEARVEAEKRRVVRVASLTKQLSKLNALSHGTLI